MAASAEIISKPVTSAISLRWIIGARDDLVWFIGSVVSSYALLFLYAGLVPLVPMVALWAILIDARMFLARSHALTSIAPNDRTARDCCGVATFLCHWTGVSARGLRVCLSVCGGALGLLSPRQTALRFHGAL